MNLDAGPAEEEAVAIELIMYEEVVVTELIGYLIRAQILLTEEVQMTMMKELTRYEQPQNEYRRLIQVGYHSGV